MARSVLCEPCGAPVPRGGRAARLTRLLTALCATVLVVGLVPSPARADSVRDSEWAARYLHLDEVHKSSQGAGVTVGVIDTGVDADHPDLQGNVLQGIDAWNNGKGDGHDDRDGHGTAMASIIAGHGHDSESGVLGVAPKAKILPVSVEYDRGYKITDQSMASGIKWAVQHGATVLNVSISGSGADAIESAVDYALDHDVVVVAGAGNTADGAASMQFPAAYDGVIAVSSIGKDGKFSSTSVTDAWMDIAAPGVDVVGAAPGGGYEEGTGTSDATAFVSGAVALIRSRFPNLSAKQVQKRLRQTATDKGEEGHDPKYGDGVLDIQKALNPDVKITGSPSPTLSPIERPSDIPGFAEMGDDDQPMLWIVRVGLLVILAATVFFVVWFVRWRRRRKRLAPGHSSRTTPEGSSGSPSQAAISSPQSSADQWQRPPTNPPGPTIGAPPPPS